MLWKLFYMKSESFRNSFFTYTSNRVDKVRRRWWRLVKIFWRPWKKHKMWRRVSKLIGRISKSPSLHVWNHHHYTILQYQATIIGLISIHVKFIHLPQTSSWSPNPHPTYTTTLLFVIVPSIPIWCEYPTFALKMNLNLVFPFLHFSSNMDFIRWLVTNTHKESESKRYNTSWVILSFCIVSNLALAGFPKMP